MPDTKFAKAGQHAGPHRDGATFAADARTIRVLVAVDGSEGTNTLLKRLIEFNERRAAIDVVLLNVQPRPQEWRLRGYQWFRRREIEDRLINDLGGLAVASAARELDMFGIPHRHRIELGDPADVIVRCARDEGCELIVLAEPPPGIVRHWLMTALGLALGSVASVVVHLAPMPVLVAK